MLEQINASKLLEKQLGDLGATCVEVELASARMLVEHSPGAVHLRALEASIAMGRAVLEQLRSFEERPSVEAGDVLYRGRFYSPRQLKSAVVLLSRAQEEAKEQRRRLLRPLVLIAAEAGHA